MGQDTSSGIQILSTPQAIGLSKSKVCEACEGAVIEMMMKKNNTPDNVISIPWTWDEFCVAMEAAGWKRIPNSPIKEYRHSDSGNVFNPFEWIEWQQQQYQAWTICAKEHEVPNR